MPANVPANVRGVYYGFDNKDPDRDNFWPPNQLPKHLFELKDKWCEHCGRRHAQGQCQYLMVDHMLKEGLAEKKALTERLFQEGWEGELQRRLSNWRAVEALRQSTNGGNTVSTSQQQQQAGPRASRFTEGPFEVSDSEDESNYEDESDIDDVSASEPAPTPEATHAQKQSETGKSKESEESFCLFVLLPLVFLLILCACSIYLVAKFGLRLGLAVYEV